MTALAAYEEQPLAEWQEKWAPACPDSSPQRIRRASGFRERNVGELELRVNLGGNDHGVCKIALDERDDEIYVRVIVCCDDADTPQRVREWMNCPVRTWLKRPLDGRRVIDADTNEELPLHTLYRDRVPDPERG